jgi:hypothetical protein
MQDAQKLAQKFRSLQNELGSLVETIIKDLSIEIEILQKDQLWAGLDGDGKKLRVGYSQDDFFKSPESAARYAKFKKDYDTPNLIINGKLVYDRIDISVGGNKLIISAASPILSELQSKYGETFGLGEIAFAHFQKTYFIPIFVERLKTFFDV